VTYMLLLNCALKLVEKIIVYYDARSKKHQSTSFGLLRERIHHNRRELDNTSRELLEMHLHLASVLSKSDWSLIDQLTFNQSHTCEG